MSHMAVTPNPPVNTADAPGVDRPRPTDAPGTRDSAGWVKADASGPGGWQAIDDVEGADSGVWRQC